MLFSLELKNYLLESGWNLADCSIVLYEGLQPKDGAEITLPSHEHYIDKDGKLHPSKYNTDGYIDPSDLEEYKEYYLYYYKKEYDEHGMLDYEFIDNTTIDKVFYDELDVLTKTWKDKAVHFDDEEGIKEWLWLDD
tara:strand:- start:352 stop:759 length:408 start_codon:yes stop_codon:yes gene_type:complete